MLGLRRNADRLLPLGVVFLGVGLCSAIVTPMLSLFLSTEVHADPVLTTTYLVVVPLAAVGVASAVGRLSDRWQQRRRFLIVAGTAGLIGTASFAVLRDYWVLLAIATTVSALASTLFPQSFAYAREVMQRADPARSALAISTLRTVFAVAWIAGPPLGAVLLSSGGFTALYGTAAATYAVCVTVVVFVLKDAPRATATAGGRAVAPGVDASRSRLWLTFAGFTALQCVGLVGVQSTALYVTQDLHGVVRDAGLILGLCAALEIPLMLAFGALSTRFTPSRLILIGTASGVVYYGLATAVGHGWQLAVLQLFNAVFVAAWNGLGISYVQDMLPRHPGRATTLFTNTYPIGAIAAGPVIGAGQHFGFRYAFGAAATLCLLGLILLASGRARGGRRRDAGGLAAPDAAAATRTA